MGPRRTIPGLVESDRGVEMMEQDGRPTASSQASSRPNSGPVSILTCAACGTKNRIRPSAKGAPHCAKCGAPLPWDVIATDATFDIETTAAVAVLVDLWAPWCGPCRFVSPILEQLAKEFRGRLKVVRVNVDENPGLVRRFDASSIPTLLVIRDGRVVDRIVGAMPKPDLTVRLTPYLMRRDAPAGTAATGMSG
jgi:thioredoxin 2